MKSKEVNPFDLFPIGMKVYYATENIEAVVTAHGWVGGVTNTQQRLGIKVYGELGSALLYNRTVLPQELKPVPNEK